MNKEKIFHGNLNPENLFFDKDKEIIIIEDYGIIFQFKDKDKGTENI